MKASNFFSKRDIRKILSAIEDAELCTSAEIKIHIETRCETIPYERALEVFNILELQNTQERNGVLIYISVSDKKIAIVGDEGINNKLDGNYWQNALNKLIDNFKHNKFRVGVIEAINHIGDQLSEHFSYQSDDINEISNEISIYDN